jgi:hypothetical protein
MNQRIKEKGGASGRIRTTDTAIFSRMLYQLSYRGAHSAGGPMGRRAVGSAPMAKRAGLGKGANQSSSGRTTCPAISSGKAGRPGTA